ncbi:MAG: dTDP-4-dehydro-6-deoxyglucose aminotransferase [Hyphomicrobiales bacterium]|nr:dTDP-4-dehydro-6-deoxyglucose aminotransferase [Hyphomicrobiales bacterium]
MKTYLDQLAIFGGTTAFEKKLHVGRPNIGDHTRLLDRIENAINRRWLTNNGPYVQEFEARLAEFTGAKHVIVMSNATIALEIVSRALGLSGEVIVPSFTFIATAHALQWQEITPVFCDIDPKTHNIDPSKVEASITPRTSGIVGVHVWGRPCDVDALQKIGQHHGLKIIYDAAHAFGCTHKGRMIGNSGDAEVFSFHATKFFNSFEGGAVATNDDELAQKIRLMKNFGFAGTDNVIYIGTNGKMHEITAAMGLTSLESVDTFLATNYRNYKLYQEGLSDLPGIQLLQYNEDEKNNYQYIVVEVDEVQTGISRDDLVKILWSENVLARRYFYPGCHQAEPYRSYYPHARLLLPETEKLTQRVLVLPNGTAVGAAEISMICQIMRLAVERGPEVVLKLQV